MVVFKPIGKRSRGSVEEAGLEFGAGGEELLDDRNVAGSQPGVR